MKRRQYLAAGLSVPLLSGCLGNQTGDGETTVTETTTSATTIDAGSTDRDIRATVARHQGYETAFLETTTVNLTL
jgi:hypothetical protein